MRRLLMAAIICWATVWTVSAAQVDEAIPACTSSELTAIVARLDEYDIAADLQAVGDVAALIDAGNPVPIRRATRQAAAAQLKFWNEFAPELPRCTLAVDILRVFGRFWDETLITLLAAQSEYADVGPAHVDLLDAIAIDIIEFAAQTGEAF